MTTGNNLFQIRRVHSDQIMEIADLWNELKDHHLQRTTHFSGYYRTNDFENRRAELLSKDKLAIFAAEMETELVGFCIVSIVGSVGEVDSLYVKPAVRNLQIGRQLMESGMAWLDKENPQDIRLLVGQGNEEAITFYEQYGFVKRATQMEKL